jgi:hypothetical protein
MWQTKFHTHTITVCCILSFIFLHSRQDSGQNGNRHTLNLSALCMH